MKSEERIVNSYGVPHGGTDFRKPADTGCTAPAGSNSLAFPVSWVTMPEHHFPSTAPTQADFPPHFPEKQKHPGKSGVPLRGAVPWRPR